MFAFLPTIGGPEMIVIMVLAVLLFGKRLPEVGRSLGKGIVEFKKGVKGIEEELDSAVNVPPKQLHSARPADPAVPKFEPPTASGSYSD